MVCRLRSHIPILSQLNIEDLLQNIRKETWEQKLRVLIITVFLYSLFMVGCATQYHHPIKKTADFYDDLALCENNTESKGLKDGMGASYRMSVEECMRSEGWRPVKQACFDKRLGSRIPSSEECR